METLIGLDKQLLLLLNGSESSFVDGLAMSLTNAKTWIPLYLSLLYLVVRNNDNIKRVLLIVASAGLCILLAGTIDDTIVKPLVGRLRPTHDPEIGALVDTVNGYRGGLYGFFSAHASNTFSIAVFFSLLVRRRILAISLILWSLTNCWTRMYLGVHFPGDILCGLIWGGAMGILTYQIYKYIISSEKTSVYFKLKKKTDVYDEKDIRIVLIVLGLSVIYCIVKGMLF